MMIADTLYHLPRIALAAPRSTGGLTCFQRDVLRHMDGQPLRVGAGWVWPSDVRRDAKLAERVFWVVLP